MNRMSPLLLSLSLVLGSSALAETTNITTIGQPNCGEWLQARDSYKRGWLFGYLTAMNTMWKADEKQPVNPLGAISSPSQAVLWVDRYCSSDPLKDVGEAAIDLFFELARTRAKK